MEGRGNLQETTRFIGDVDMWLGQLGLISMKNKSSFF